MCSTTRRPRCWVGDALQALAFQLLSEHRLAMTRTQLEMVKTLAVAAGSRGMAGGQQIDLEAIGKGRSAGARVHAMHKTGAIIRAACYSAPRAGNFP